MSDDTTMMQPQPQLPTPGAPGDKKPGFMSTPGGKMVAIILGLCVIGIVIGIGIAFALATFGEKAVEDLAANLQESQAATQSATATGTPEADKTPAQEVANKDVFTFRDVFEPILKKEVKESATTTSSVTPNVPDSQTPTVNNTLYLDGVITENGILKAKLRYNGQSYTLAAGGTIPNSPWEVLRVSSTSVIMLYGDVQVTISVGQGITK